MQKSLLEVHGSVLQHAYDRLEHKAEQMLEHGRPCVSRKG